MFMNVALFFISIFAILCCKGVADDSYLLSSEPLIHQNQTSLKGYTSFVFAPILKTREKERNKITALMHQELQRVGSIEKKRVFTEQGADLTALSSPSLEFTLEQLADQEGKLLPVIKASLSTRSSVEVLKNNEINSLSTNYWSVYFKQSDDVEKIIKKALPSLLNKFIAEFRIGNGKELNPTFYIIDANESTSQEKNKAP